MSYGLQVTNNNGETVFDSNSDVYVKKRSGVLPNLGLADPSVSNGRFYRYIYTGTDAETSGDEILMFDIDTDKSIGFPPPTDLDELGEVMYEDTSLRYVVMAPRSQFPSPSGYGMAIFDENGTCIWDAESSLVRIGGGLIERDEAFFGSRVYETGVDKAPNLVTGGLSSLHIKGFGPNTGIWILCVTFLENGPLDGRVIISTEQFGEIEPFGLEVVFENTLNVLYGYGS